MDLRIDIFSARDQGARATRELTPTQLIAAIIQEFREIEQLGDDPARYQLLRVADHTALLDDHKLERQAGDITRLVLVDRPVTLPVGTHALGRRVYLREQERNKVFRLHWQPAVIGRRQSVQGEEPPLAVNLADHAARDYISKRHAQIIEQGGRLMVESLTSKPTRVVTANGDPVDLVEGKPYPLTHGDVIHLINSRVELRVLIDDDLATISDDLASISAVQPPQASED